MIDSLKNISKLWLGALALFYLVGCTSFGTQPEDIIERSKRLVPTWVAYAGDKFHDADDRLIFVLGRSHFQSLPLAVKETQAANLMQSEKSLEGLVHEALVRVAAEQKIKIVNGGELLASVGGQVKASHQEHANVKDIYYEKLKGARNTELEEYYRVFVRIDYLKENLPGLFKGIGVKLSKSNHADMVQLGRHLSNNSSQLLGH